MKKCGPNQSCFVRGESWGHYAAIMCEHIGEQDDRTICHLTQEIVENDETPLPSQTQPSTVDVPAIVFPKFTMRVPV
jgi:hypothetical protein